ncbi:MAG: ROK family protein [Candidatus Schekmanbacteria bacterium]|nr:ROK family protein [Candidatus Schekmanbacteria bacterium]
MITQNKKKKHLVAAIDYGGTKILAGIIDDKGKIISSRKVLTPDNVSKEIIIKTSANLLEEVCRESEISVQDTLGIGIAAPGIVSSKSEMLLYAPNWKIRNFDFKKIFEKRFGVKVRVANDINAAAVAELNLGHGKREKSFFWITISTGIGGALVLDGKLITGKRGLAGEIGHINIKENGPLCKCGKRGCLEAISSGPAILNTAIERIGTHGKKKNTRLELAGLTTQKIVEAANKGDKLAYEIINETSREIARGISYIVNLADIDLMVLGGGVILKNPLMFRLIKKHIRGFIYEADKRDFRLTLPKFGYDSCLIGAASLILFDGK